MPLMIVVAFVSGAVIGAKFFAPSTGLSRPIYSNAGTYTHPLLGFEVNTQGEFQELNPIERTIRDFIAKNQDDRTVKTISIYFRLLNSGRWFSINPEETYSPASLLKIPIMMVYFKKAEDNPNVLDQKLYDDGTFADQEQTTVPEARRLHEGSWYTIEDLIERMIRDSNNEAKNMLEQNLPDDFIKQIYDKLDVENPYQKKGDFMTVDDYPFFLRVLYNTTYLNEKYSEEALELLAESSFVEGLPAQLPDEITVAHKFGFRVVNTTNPPLAELHDCGIVYYPDHPYVLCVMTKGYDPDALISAIQNLSLLTYRGVDQFFKVQ